MNMCNIYFGVSQASIPAKSSVPNRAPARAMSSSGASADVEFEAVLSDQPQGPGETRPQNQVRGPALLCSPDLARFCQWSRLRRRSSISWRRSSRFAFISARSWRRPRISASKIGIFRAKSAASSFAGFILASRFPATLLQRRCRGAGVDPGRADLRCDRPFISRALLSASGVRTFHSQSSDSQQSQGQRSQ
jgi:hypothetical protein